MGTLTTSSPGQVSIHFTSDTTANLTTNGQTVQITKFSIFEPGVFAMLKLINRSRLNFRVDKQREFVTNSLNHRGPSPRFILTP